MITVAIVVLVVSAALRSTWSPCGASMLSSITPLSERSRGNRYWVTFGWFLFGCLVGGLTLGAVAAAGALAVGAVGVPAAVVLLVAGILALASDLGIGGLRLPHNPRQVNRAWLDRYRGWVYAVGFGWQLGVGVATYVMTAGVYLVIVAGALSADPWVALGMGVAFGLVRGLAILPAASVRHPAELMRIHTRFEALRPASRVVGVVGIVAVTVAAAATLWGTWGTIAVGLGLAGAAVAFRSGLRDPLPDAPIPTTPITLSPTRS